MNSQKIGRIDDICVRAIDDIRSKVYNTTGMRLSFREGSQLVGIKYFRYGKEIKYEDVVRLFGTKRLHKNMKRVL